MKRLIFIFPLLFTSIVLFSQNNYLNYLTELFSPQQNALGNVGVVSSDFNCNTGILFNPALLNKYEGETGVTLGYGFNNIGIIKSKPLSLGVYYSLNRNNTFAYSYNSGLYNTFFENLYHSFRFAHSFNEKLSLGIGLKNFSGTFKNKGKGLRISNIGPGGCYFEPIELKEEYNSFCADFGVDYRDNIMLNENNTIRYDLGMDILNLGSKVDVYKNEKIKEFTPSTLDLGALITFSRKTGEVSSINYSIGYQLNKLMLSDQFLSLRYNFTELESIISDISVLEEITESFSNPMIPISHHFSAEAFYNIKNEHFAAIRLGGYTTGMKNYFNIIKSFGFGVGIKHFEFNFAYILDLEDIGFSIGYRKNFDWHKKY